MKKDDRQLVMNLQEEGKHYSMDWVNAARETKDWYTKSTLPLPSPQFIKEVLHYDSKTGKLFWKERKNNRNFNARMAGKEVVLKIDTKGRTHHQISFGKRSKKIYYHRVVWCWYYGEWPDDDLVIDHINGDATDNRIDNLRLVTRQENSMNQKRKSSNTSGHAGVSWNKTAQVWSVYVNSKGNRIYLGTFKDKAQAVETRKKAEIEYGYHENHGRSG